MALPKRVKVGGSYYKGYSLVVSSTAGDYVLVVPFTQGCAINGFSVTPDAYGAGDSFKLLHVDTTAASGGTVVSTLAETVYMLGAGVTISLDFVSLELCSSGDSFRMVYTNSAGTSAVNVYTIVERVQ